MSQASIQINTRQVGIERKSFGTGWRTFRRQVQVLGEDSHYSDVEVGQVQVKRQTVRVYRRKDQAGWSSDYESVVRYATPRKTTKNS